MKVYVPDNNKSLGKYTIYVIKHISINKNKKPEQMEPDISYYIIPEWLQKEVENTDTFLQDYTLPLPTFLEISEKTVGTLSYNRIKMLLQNGEIIDSK